MKLAVLFGVMTVALSGAAVAQAPSPLARASVTILRSLTVTANGELRFGQLPHGAGRAPLTVRSAPAPARGGGAGSAPATVMLRGDPGRAYRVVLPLSVRTTTGSHAVGQLSVWSATVGDITESRIGQLDSEGYDTLSVGGVLTRPHDAPAGDYRASVPLQIAYE